MRLYKSAPADWALSVIYALFPDLLKPQLRATTYLIGPTVWLELGPTPMEKRSNVDKTACSGRASSLGPSLFGDRLDGGAVGGSALLWGLMMLGVAM